MNDKKRKGDWIQTYSGKQFWPIDPRPEDICMEDVAHALSLICRFSGHCRRFYSVAQHSVLVSELVEPEFALWGLLHDASEAYLSDIARPVKPYLANYQELELGIEKCIAERFDLVWPMPAAVKKADSIMLATEARDLMKAPPADWNFMEPPADFTVVPRPPEKAELMFLQRLLELTGM